MSKVCPVKEASRQARKSLDVLWRAARNDNFLQAAQPETQADRAIRLAAEERQLAYEQKQADRQTLYSLIDTYGPGQIGLWLRNYEGRS